jgi:UDP-2,4-diacetamido-2,4,6-trideoxy-beta-L-altropyranose hydrolase
MRCLTLAQALRAKGMACRFICRAHEGHMAVRIEAAGFPVTLIPVDPDFAARDDYDGWRGGSAADDIRLTREAIAREGGADILVVDHYGLDAAFERALRPYVGAIVSFDDLHDKPHDCDLLIDQNIGHMPDCFASLVSPETVLLVGANYAPLSADFAERRAASLERRSNMTAPRSLLVAVGGSDHLDVTSRVLSALDPKSGLSLGWIERADVVLAGMAPHLERVKARAAELPAVKLHVDTHAMPDLMLAADLAIGGCGVTAIERCVMGLPTLTFVMAENQEGSALELERAGAAVTLGHGAGVTPGAIAAKLNEIHTSPSRYRDMIESAAGLCDGRGLQRCVPDIIALARPNRRRRGHL